MMKLSLPLTSLPVAQAPMGQSRLQPSNSQPALSENLQRSGRVNLGKGLNIETHKIMRNLGLGNMPVPALEQLLAQLKSLQTKMGGVSTAYFKLIEGKVNSLIQKRKSPHDYSHFG